MNNKQLSQWTGKFGDEYIWRNPATEEVIKQRSKALCQIFNQIRQDPPISVLEVGANIGINLRALKQINNFDLWALEPNSHALAKLIAEKVVDRECALQGVCEQIPLPENAIDFVFSCTVLIHVSDENIEKALNEMHRVSRRYICFLEYFSPETEQKIYRGHAELLFKRDFGSLYQELFPQSKLVDYGFFWKPITAFDNVTYWIF